MNWRVIKLNGDRFFNPDFDIFINREVESFSLSQHTHDFIEISYVEEGNGYHYVEDQMIPIKRGDLFVIPIGTSHVFRPTSQDNPLVIYNCIFRTSMLEQLRSVVREPSILHSLFYGSQPSAVKWLQFQDKFDKFLTVMQGMYREFLKKEAQYEFLMMGQLIQVLAMLQRYECDGSLVSTPTNKMDDAIQYINDHYAANLTVQQVSERSFMSPSHFQRLFKKTTGVTFMTYLQNFRIQRCCELLKSTEMTIQEAANQVGYQDMKFFHELFRKKTGVTPREYRRNSPDMDYKLASM
ncbi:AraC family transcriptional regulator [Paenibacillus sp. N4]|uniref:AraC family transcriptional regulator n=1 Tax=Paenibacillus vietnamensis TaxID=2590547 RepID=UPI001CD0B599|nr:AraC family transcriptional regulator [Paenibacillus vietnamensis]MCA0758626.1 AraC family transcriptional regulator [Paenibacillus vietnamensis]